MKEIEEQIRERMTRVEETAARNFSRIADAGFNVKTVSDQAFSIVQENMSSRAKLGKLIALVDSVAATVAPFVACKETCSGCCYIPVPISEVEAERIGAAIGRPPAKMASDHEASMEKFTGVVCTFLVDRKCSIYEHRPMSCRAHVSLDEDPLLCEAQPYGRPDVKVYSLDLRFVDLAYVMMNGARHVADVREFFPANR
ncbi:YkgJ family cysteine cluster protein [Rugamonas sp. A1-17]|nr:YkgJ family cysteine cluster protein [Rugamonas sp. A1-17]